jgi:hypothetical protein
MRTAELGVVIGPDGTHRKEIEIRTCFERPPRRPMWTVGISICLLAASAIVAVVQEIPASYASIPDESAPSTRGGALRSSESAQLDDPQARLAVTHRRSRARCPECGFVESIRYIEDSGKVSVAGDGSGGAIAASAATGKHYEITVRFRDGSTTAFNEATTGTWRLGSQMIVIGGSKVSND